MKNKCCPYIQKHIFCNVFRNYWNVLFVVNHFFMIAEDQALICEWSGDMNIKPEEQAKISECSDEIFSLLKIGRRCKIKNLRIA